jgi:3-dehydroquinate synthase
MSEHIEVDLGTRTYIVSVGAGLLADDAPWSALRACRHLLVVTDDNVGPLYLPALQAFVPDHQLAVVTIPAGEASKTLDQCTRVFEALAAMRAGRDAGIIALGGGVIGDLAGFAAACWMRGIGFVQVPTTLLAMVDSSVGGKTGVNLPFGKNLVGAFHQPEAVIADIDTLATLPARERAAGLAEVVKYGAIGDAAFFAWLEDHAGALVVGDREALVHAIATSVRHKAAIVARDERESGERALLNFGHTFGHAIETATGYRRYLHGEAVAIGMVQAARLSERLGLAPRGDGDRMAALLERLGLPVHPPAGLDAMQLLDLMRLDKKALSSGMRFVVWHGIGKAELRADIDDAEVLAVLEA